MSTKIITGDKVLFDADKLEIFLDETISGNKELETYKEHILSCIGQVGIAKETGHPFTVVAYPGNKELQVPTKYLVKLPPM